MAITTILIPATINFSKNFIPVKFQSDSYLDGLGFEKENYRIYVELWVQNAANTTFELINTQNLPLIFASAGQAQTDLKDTLHAILEDAGPDYMDVADTSFLSVKKSVRKFYLKYAESVDGVVAALTQTVDFTVAYGGLSYQSSFSSNLLLAIQPDAGDATKDRFLRQGNGTQFTRTNQPQFLYFLNTRATANASLKAKFYFTDNSTPLILTPCSGSLTALSKFAFNVKFDQIITSVQLAGKTCQKYEVWLENTAAAKISETRTFFLDYQLKEYVRYFTYWNSWGAVNTLLTYGKASSKIEIIQSEAQRIRKAGDDIKKGDRLNFDISLNNDFSCATGFVSRREIAFNRDFYLSPFKFRYTGGKLLPISVTSKNIAEVNDGNGLYAQNFDYKYLFDDDCYTEGDLEDGVGIDGFFFNLNPANPTQGFSETDPTVPGWVKSISLADIANWNAGTGAGGTANWGQISGAIINQTDLINYLNGNFYSKSEINNYFGGVTSITGYNKTNWDNAFGWGNHAGIYKAISYTPSNAEVISALGFTPISGINNGMVISALGYTPYNASNPSQYINASSDAFIKNQNTFQSGAVLHVKGGNFAEYLTIPTVLSNDPGTNNKPQLYYDAAGLGGSAIPAIFNLGNLANVNVTGVADDYVMYYHALSNTYKFKAATFGGTPVDAYTKSETNNHFAGLVAITGYNKANWDNAFSYGNHAGLYSLLAHTHTYASLTSKPTTIAGYGITDFNSLGDARFQPLENQRLSVGNNVSFGTGVFGGALTGNTLDIITGIATFNNIQIDGGGNRGIKIWDGVSAYITRLSFAPTGAATFGVTVTAPTFVGALNGNANSATNSTQWNGLNYSGSALAGSVGFTMVYDGVNNRQGVASSSQMQSFLGLGSAAYQSDNRYFKYLGNIASNSNANSFTTDGVVLNTTGNGTGNSNYPDTYGILTQVGSESGYSYAQNHYTNNGTFKTRVFWGNVWSAWREVQFKDELGSAAYLNASQGALANSIAQRDSSGYINGTYINMSDGLIGAGQVTGIIAKASDNYYRTSDAGGVRTFLGLGTAAYQSDAKYFQYATFTADANTLAGNRSAFTYQINAPYNGPIAHFEASGYGLQLNATYNASIGALAFRARNGDSGTWNPWKRVITTDDLSQGATGNTIAQRTVDGDISSRYSFSSYVNTTDNVETGGLTYLIGKFGDNYHRSATANKVQAFLGMPSGGDTLQSVISRGNSTSTTIYSSTTEALRINADAAYISGYNTAGTVRNGYLQFVADGTNLQAQGNELLKLNPSGGNVQIGYIANQGYKLSVNGTGYFAGNLTARDIRANRGDGTGVIYFGASDIKYLYYDGSSYYLNAAGLVVGGTVTASGVLILNAANSGHSYHQLNRVSPNENMFVWNDSGIAKWYLGQRVINGGTGFQLYNATQGTNHVNFYASGNTAFGYADSADNGHKLSVNGTGYFSNYIQTPRLVNTVSVDTDNTFGMYFNSSQTADYAIYREAGAWTHPYPDLRIAFHTGIKLGAYFGYGGTRFYNNSDMATQIFSVGDSDNHVRVFNDLYVSGAITAPTIRATSSLQIPVKPGGVANGQTVELYYQP